MGEDIEKQPLLEKSKVEETAEDDEADSMSYDARKLITFEVFRATTGTIWVKGSLWRSMGLLLVLALLTALGVAFMVKEPEKLETDEFSKLNGFLKAIVGLLLGFFLSSSVNRWYACASGFLALFNAIRALHMQLAAIGSSAFSYDTVPTVRCGVSAGLHYSLSGQTLPKDERLEWRAVKFDAMCEDKENLDDQVMSSGTLAKIHPKEKEILAKVEDPSQTLWVWVTSLLTRMASDGEIPAMPTPTYGKILSLADQAYGGIREVQGAICVQPPYVYVQTIAMLVNVNNIVTAVSFGMTLGVTLSVAKSGKNIKEVISADLQDVLIQFIMSTTGPFLYQTLLEVAVCIAQPFAGCSDEKNDSPGRIPTWKLLSNLKKDLGDAEYMTNRLPCWEQAVHGLATGLLQQAFCCRGDVTAEREWKSDGHTVFELTVLLSLILVHHFPSMPAHASEGSQRLEELQEPLLDSLASWEDRIWVAILTSGCVFLAFTVLGKFQEPNCKKYPQLCADTSGYVVVLDAGSTGTRVHVFNYEYRKLEPRRFPLIVSPPLTLPTEIAAATNKPGLSSFVHQTEGIPRKLDELIRHAADALLLHNPDVQLKQVPLYLGATAGLRELHNRDRDEVMKAAREYLRKQEVFAVTRDEQVRVLSGEEEGAFGWLALNQLQAEISPDSDTTLGALDFGGASMQIAFVPQETSILAGLFPMHFGGSVKGPIHLYSHSFTGYGSVVAFQRATRVLLESHRKRKTEEEVKHPCMPTGLTWNVNHDEFGVSRQTLVGTGDFDGCYALTAPLFDKETPCFLPPCSMMGVYQPRLNGTRFVLFGEYARFKQWEVLPLVQKAEPAERGLPLMKALEVQLPRLCSLPLRTQVELFGGSSMRHGPDCWMATWIFAMLKDGLGFSVHGYPQVDVVPSCCDHTLGHATYEVNFFPYSVSRSSYMSLAAKQLHLDELGSVDLREWCPGLSAVQAILFAAAGACLLLLLQSTRKRVWPASKAEPLLQAV
ncbi:Golgi apyrase (ATP-diphosphatase) (ATP-diphosphohydrolase) (Adenosine diphosphatase) (ADPase) (Golgi nucleoside diphosphatase) [Durusdinium trenchii]|uniref:Golgi apyrase (ATP-diphosphatase) (ATP-diphosphohydrolase) (Adenosine diphosphatase) (ADPase) (Golgi nucleoside diphosphatase) n=1 Tax=Durusdinium trenchii TaxID=1381693 RepID=A0ABP0REG9_9DINO